MPDFLFLNNRFEYYSYGHALEILENAFPDEWGDLTEALYDFWIEEDWIIAEGGNKSNIAKRLDDLLFPRGWTEQRITGDLVITQHIRSGRIGEMREQDFIVKDWIEGHNIDFVKNKVALDLEWNSKDQTFDRDLMAMRAYFDSGVIDVGVIITRSENLSPFFREWGLHTKYGASTTHIDKLLYRLDNRRSGGCPVLAIGIRLENVLR